MSLEGALTAAVRPFVLPSSPSADAKALGTEIARAGGGSVLGVLFFGSRKTHAHPDPFSAYDFFVLTRNYRGFYAELRAGGLARRSPALLAALNAILPPNVISLVLPDAPGAETRFAKCAVISLAAFERETSGRRRDQFCVGRLFQPTEIVYAADAAVEGRLLGCLTRACLLTYDWVRPWLPDRFDAREYGRTLLRVSLGREIRPEPAGRADELWEAQRTYLDSVFTVLLRGLAGEGELTEVAEGTYSLARPVPRLEGLRARSYFVLSMVRATLRWTKYMLTFDDWLEYILRKVRRHTGQEIVLTRWERRLPVVFLWPRLVRYLRQKDDL